MSDRTNVAVAAEALASLTHGEHGIPEAFTGEARVALAAIDLRLAVLTPEDTKAILDYALWWKEAAPYAPGAPAISAHAWEVLS